MKRLKRFFYWAFLFLFLQPTYADYRFLSISDIHYGSSNTPGDGHDTDPVLLKSALTKFSDLSKRVDFIVTLGDFPTHTLLNSSETKTYIQTVFHELYKANNRAKPMFYITGNNDSLQGNYQPFSWKGISPLSVATDWEGACIHCKGLLIDGSHLKDKGYYSTYVMPGNKDILLIALNSVQFTKVPFGHPDYPNQDKDATQQLQWLEGQLNKHHSKQLLIAMHVPPGNDYKGQLMWYDAYLKQFISLLQKNVSHYGEISLLTAHTHMDDIRKIFLDKGKTIYAYATPSISRNHHNNPGMKVFQLNNEIKIKNYTTYYTTIDSPWENTHYSAIKKNNPIFGHCHHKTLKGCLDDLPDLSVCAYMKAGLFYGVKSPNVDNEVCNSTYVVNADRREANKKNE